MSRVILVASGKGGTGKTVFTVNAGAVLAKRGHKVALIDMDLGLRNLDLCLGLEDKVVYDVLDVLSGMCRIKQALIKDKRFSGLYLMAAPPSGKTADITPLHIKVLCKKLKKEFDYILIDAPAGVGELVLLSAAGADTAVIVTTPEYAAVRDADILDTALKENGLKNTKYVVNKVNGDLITTGLIPRIPQIADRIRALPVGIIQYDDSIHLAANNGVPVVLKSGTYIENNFSKIIDRVIV